MVPRYFFHFSDGKRRFSDTTGVELNGMASARAHAIRQVTLSSRAVSTIAGVPGVPGLSDGATATFNYPYGIALDASSTFAVVVDSGNNQLRLLQLGVMSASLSPTSTPSPTPSATASSVCGCIVLDGSTDLLGPPGFPALGSGDFTIETWAKRTSGSPGYQRLFSLYPAGATFWSQVWVEVAIEVMTGGASAARIVASVNGVGTPASVPMNVYDPSAWLGQWQHWAAVRLGSILSLYIDGVPVASISGLSGSIGNSGSTFYVGGRDPGAPSVSQWAGLLADFRIVAGTALYTYVDWGLCYLHMISFACALLLQDL